ncbi:thioredoxin family protein [Planctomycetes bacterium CA13]
MERVAIFQIHSAKWISVSPVVVTAFLVCIFSCLFDADIAQGETSVFAGVHNVTSRASATNSPNGETAKVSWFRDFRAGWRESVRRNVPMVIYISSDNCSYCEAMQRDTWCDSSIRQRLGRDFVAIHLTPEQNEATLRRIKVDTYPTTLIGAPEGKVVGHRRGYQPVVALHQLLSESFRGGPTK